METKTFSVLDPLKRTITLTSDAWEHIHKGHEEIKVGAVKTTVESPEFIFPSNKEPKSDLYYRLGVDDEYRNLYYKVVVKFDEIEKGSVVTAFLQFKVDDSGGPKYVNIHK